MLEMSSTVSGLSSPGTTISSVSLSSVFHRDRGRELYDVIKAVKAVARAQDKAMRSRRQALAVVQMWSSDFKDEASRELVHAIHRQTNGQWRGVESEMLPKLQLVLARLQELRKDEGIRNRLTREARNAEQTFYRAMYKNREDSETRALERIAKQTRERARLADCAFRDATTATVSECLRILFEQMVSTFDGHARFAKAALELVEAHDQGLGCPGDRRVSQFCSPSSSSSSSSDHDSVPGAQSPYLMFHSPDQRGAARNSYYHRIASFLSAGRAHKVDLKRIDEDESEAGNRGVTMVNQENDNQSEGSAHSPPLRAKNNACSDAARPLVDLDEPLRELNYPLDAYATF